MEHKTNNYPEAHFSHTDQVRNLHMAQCAFMLATRHPEKIVHPPKREHLAPYTIDDAETYLQTITLQLNKNDSNENDSNKNNRWISELNPEHIQQFMETVTLRRASLATNDKPVVSDVKIFQSLFLENESPETSNETTDLTLKIFMGLLKEKEGDAESKKYQSGTIPTFPVKQQTLDLKLPASSPKLDVYA